MPNPKYMNQEIIIVGKIGNQIYEITDPNCNLNWGKSFMVPANQIEFYSSSNPAVAIPSAHESQSNHFHYYNLN